LDVSSFIINIYLNYIYFFEYEYPRTVKSYFECVAKGKKNKDVKHQK
jgi:hypothetical protein